MISQLFSEASREIRVGQRIVFVGYSMSEADVHIKALFKKHLQDSTEVIVVNIKPPQELRPAYSALSSKVHFIQCSFEEMVSD